MLTFAISLRAAPFVVAQYLCNKYREFDQSVKGPGHPEGYPSQDVSYF